MPYIIQEGASVAVGDVGPDNIKWQNLDSAQLPDLEEMSEAHHGGGSIGEIEWGSLGIKALAPSFKLKGYDGQVLSQFGQRLRVPYTFRGILRDKRTQKPQGLRAIFYARLGKVSGDAFERGKLMGHDHGLIEVVHYELYLDEKEKFYWDWNEPAWRVDGVNMLADEMRLLALPGT